VLFRSLSLLPAGNVELAVGATVRTPAQLVGPFLIEAVTSSASPSKTTLLQ
jgi:hypothetical protein